MEVINLYVLEASLENEAGALELQKGNVAYALETFQNALDILNQLRQLPFLPPFDPKRDREPQNCISVDVPYIKNDRFFCYHRALIFPRNSDPTCCSTTTRQRPPPVCSVHRLAFYSCVVLQNMALAYHMLGQALKNDQNLSMSLFYYSESLKMARGLPINLESADADLLRVVALNNSAAILRHRMDFYGASMAMDEIRSKLRHALVIHRHSSRAFPKEDIEGFILNTMEALPPTGAAVA